MPHENIKLGDQAHTATLLNNRLIQKLQLPSAHASPSCIGRNLMAGLPIAFRFSGPLIWNYCTNQTRRSIPANNQRNSIDHIYATE
jgi:hypothetical protein